MDWIYDTIETWGNLGLHRYGWLFVSLVLIIPAIVCGNMCVYYCTAITRAKTLNKKTFLTLTLNLTGLIICILVFIMTLIQHV